MNFKKIFLYIPGFLLAILIAYISRIIEDILPIHMIGASVIAAID